MQINNDIQGHMSHTQGKRCDKAKQTIIPKGIHCVGFKPMALCCAGRVLIIPTELPGSAQLQSTTQYKRNADTNSTAVPIIIIIMQQTFLMGQTANS